MAINFEAHGKEGLFRYPEDFYDNIVEKFDEALDRRGCGDLNEKAYIATLEKLIASEPDFIDGYAHIGFCLLEQGKTKKALEVCLQGIAVAERVIPNKFKGRIEWGHFDNRPFLRAMHGAVLCHLRLRQRRDAVRLMEKMLAYNPNDNQGMRYLIGSEYMRLADTKKARAFFEREKENYPPYHYELALLHLQEGSFVAAATSLRRGFRANFYIAEMICGNPDPAPLAIWHDSNFSEPEMAGIYMSKLGDLWLHNPDFAAFVRWLYDHPKVMTERAAFLEYQEQLLWEHDFERRGHIVQRMLAVRDDIDDLLSEQIVRPREDRDGRSIFPWQYRKRAFRL